MLTKFNIQFVFLALLCISNIGHAGEADGVQHEQVCLEIGQSPEQRERADLDSMPLLNQQGPQVCVYRQLEHVLRILAEKKNELKAVEDQIKKEAEEIELIHTRAEKCCAKYGIWVGRFLCCELAVALGSFIYIFTANACTHGG